MKGKVKNGYFEFQRKYLFIPAIYVNVYRDSKFRIRLSNEKDLLTDYKQITIGTAIFIIPFYEKNEGIDMIFKRIQKYGNNWDAPQEFIEKEICNLGETVKVHLQTISTDFHVGQFSVGQRFEIREGAKTVGRGKITKILRSDFNYWNFDSFYNQLPKNCIPYDSENIQGFRADFYWAFEDLKEIKKLRVQENLSNKNEMLIVECILKNNNVKPRPFIDEVCKMWKERLSFEKSFYKLNLNYLNDKFEFELLFATWHSMYLTGKILARTIR